MHRSGEQAVTVSPGLGRIVEVVDDGYNPLLLGSKLLDFRLRDWYSIVLPQKRDLCGCSWLIQSICKILQPVSLPSSEFSMWIVRLLSSSGWERLRSESSEWSRPGRPRHELGDVQTPLKDTVESVESVEHDRHWQWVWTREPRCDKRWCNACWVRSDIWRSSYVQCRSKRCIAKRYRNTSIPEALKIRDIGKFCSAFARVNDCPKFAMGPNRSPALVPVSY